MRDDAAVGEVMYDAHDGRSDHPVHCYEEHPVEGGPEKRTRLDEGGMWVRGFGSGNDENTMSNIVECFRETKIRVKMPRFKELGKMKKFGMRNKEDVAARLRRGMMIFLKGVILEGQEKK